MMAVGFEKRMEEVAEDGTESLVSAPWPFIGPTPPHMVRRAALNFTSHNQQSLPSALLGPTPFGPTLT